MKISKVQALKRRDVLKVTTAALLSVGFAWTARNAKAQGAALDEKDPIAQQFGYRADATKVDKAKQTKYQAGQSCSMCALYQGKAGDASGPCGIFPGKVVSAKGWCNAWAKKA